MITLPITEEQIKRAEKLYPFKCLNNSIMEGKSNLYGAIGEVVLADYYRSLGMTVNEESTFDYDIIVENKKIDVKTKLTTVVPKEHYNCSVADFNTDQACDCYFFVRVHENKKFAYLLGLLRKSEFYEKATFNKKGEVDKSSDCGWTFRADCYNVPIKNLLSPRHKQFKRRKNT